MPRSIPHAQATDERIARETQALKDATTTYLALAGRLKAMLIAIEAGRVPVCKQRARADERPARSIGVDLLTSLAASKHNSLFSADGLASETLVHAVTIPFLASERASRDWSPVEAAAALAKLQGTLVPLVVIRLDEVVEPEVTADEKHYRGGHAKATAFVFSDAASPPCITRVAVASAKKIPYLTFGGASGGPNMLNARFANDLRQTVQRTAGEQLVRLGLIGALEPVVRRQSSTP